MQVAPAVSQLRFFWPIPTRRSLNADREETGRSGNREIVGVTTTHGRRTEPRRVEDVLPGTQVAGTGRLPYLMDGESARAVEEGQPSQTGQRRKQSG